MKSTRGRYAKEYTPFASGPERVAWYCAVAASRTEASFSNSAVGISSLTSSDTPAKRWS